LPRIVTVSGVKMGSPKVELGRVISQTTFELVAYAAPQEKPAATVASLSTQPGQPVQSAQSAQPGR
jgi:type IV pilus assembly protein PilO